MRTLPPKVKLQAGDFGTRCQFFQCCDEGIGWAGKTKSLVLLRLSWRWWSCIYAHMCERQFEILFETDSSSGETAGTAGCHLHTSVMKNHVAPESLYTWQRAAAPAPMLGRPQWRVGAEQWSCDEWSKRISCEVSCRMRRRVKQGFKGIVKQLLCGSDARRQGGQQRLVALKIFRWTGFVPFSLCCSEVGTQCWEGIMQLLL